MMKQLFTEKEIDIQSKIVAKQINDKQGRVLNLMLYLDF